MPLFTTTLHMFEWLNSSIWPADRTLTGTTTPGESGPESNGYEGEFHIPPYLGIVDSPSDTV